MIIVAQQDILNHFAGDVHVVFVRRTQRILQSESRIGMRRGVVKPVTEHPLSRNQQAGFVDRQAVLFGKTLFDDEAPLLIMQYRPRRVMSEPQPAR